MRIVVAGGGSGGHITPILAVAQALKSADNSIQIHYIGLGGDRERKLVSAAGLKTHRIHAGKFRRYHNQPLAEKLLDWRTNLLNMRDLVLVVVGTIQSLWLLIRLRPSCVFIKGGFVGLPVGLAAWCLRRPFMIHESDSIPGLANRILSRFTPHKVSGFDIPGFNNLGNPVRPDLVQPTSLSREDFNISSDLPIVLAFGGSLGSQSINSVVEGIARNNDEYEIIHISGNDVKLNSLNSNYHRYSFLTTNMAAALQLADVVVARAGANTLAELAALGKASIIIPHPKLADQLNNAAVFARESAVVLLQQEELSVDSLRRGIEAIIKDESLSQRLKKNITRLSRSDSAQSLASELIRLADRGGDGAGEES